MNYIITGSIGHIGSPLVKQLAQAGHQVTVITSSADRKADIEKLGAIAAVGSITDRAFLVQAFKGADAAYLMIPPNWTTPDFGAYQKEVADNYVHALKQNGIRYVVQLSSIGAHLRNGAGPIDGLGYLEAQLEKLADINVKMLRPAYFYYNLHSMGGLIKHAGIMGSNFGSSHEKLAMVHPSDIAAEAARHLLKLDFKGHSHQYIASDERTAPEIAKVLGTAIQKPDLAWVTFKDDETLQGMLQAGLSQTMAEGYTQMGKAFREGTAQEDYLKENTKPGGKIKLEEFAKDFAAVYHQSN